MLKIPHFAGISTAAAIAMVFTSLLPAQAQPLDNSPDQQAARIAEALPAGSPAPLSSTIDGDTFTAQDGEATVEVQRSGPEAMDVTTADGVQLRVNLPDVGAGEGSATTDNTLIFEGGGTDLFVQPLAGGARTGTIINSPDASERFAYSVDSFTPSVEADGSATFTAQQGSTHIQGPTTAAPWAYDANGTAVPTHYEVDGDSLVQVVDHQGGGYAYPITADPQWGWEGVLLWGYFNRSETRDMSNAGYVAATCAGIGGMVGPVVAALCAANAGSIAYNASNAYNHGNCAKLTIGPGVVLTQEYRNSRCR